MIRRLSAVFSMLLLLQLSLQVGDAACTLGHEQEAAVAMEMGASGGMMTMEVPMDMPMETHPPCGDADHSMPCNGPWAPSGCVTMTACQVAMTMSSTIMSNTVTVSLTTNFGEVPPLHSSATVTPLPPPPRA